MSSSNIRAGLFLILFVASCKSTEEKPYIPQPAETKQAVEEYVTARRLDTEAKLITWAKTPEGRDLIRKAMEDRGRTLNPRRAEIDSRRAKLMNSLSGISPKDEQKLDDDKAQVESETRALAVLRRKVLGE